MNLGSFETREAKAQKAKKEIIRNLSIINRGGMSQLIQFLESSGYFDLPASSSHHHAYRGGLALHSLEVLKLLRAELLTYNLDYFKSNKFPDTVIIVALLHDLCKVEDYYFDTLGRINKRNLPGHAKRSISLIQRYIILTEEEKTAILSHMGAYSSEVSIEQLALNYRKYPISYALHVADLRSSMGLKGRKKI